MLSGIMIGVIKINVLCCIYMLFCLQDEEEASEHLTLEKRKHKEVNSKLCDTTALHVYSKACMYRSTIIVSSWSFYM